MNETIIQGVRPLQAQASGAYAPVTLIQGGREVSVFEKAATALMARPDASLDQLQQMMAMHERWEERQAEKAFTEAMTQFKQDAPRIVKDKLVDYPGAKGRTTYMHATLATVCKAAIEGLAAVGISHKWEVDQGDGVITVRCVLTHRQGHRESVQISAGADTSGGKNSIQAVASSITYLQRYSLLSATGLATEDQDDDDGADHKDDFPAWAHEIVGTVKAAADPAALRAIRKAAAERCTLEKSTRAWNELINPAIKDKAETSGWVKAE